MKYSVKSLLDYILILLIGIFPFSPITRSLDQLNVHTLYLSMVCVFAFVILLLTRRFKVLLNTLSSKEILAFVLFLLVSLSSLIYTFNVQESVIALSRYFLFFNLLIISYTLFSEKKFFLISVIVFFGVI